MKKTKQIFSEKRRSIDSKMTSNQIAAFLNEFQNVVNGCEGKKKLISLRVPENLLKHFRVKASSKNTPYQTQIIQLMREWVKSR